MTSSQWLDVAVIAVAVIAGISGWRSGALGSLMSFLGVILGGAAGVLLAPHIVSNISGERTRLFVFLFLVLGLVVVGEVAGVVVGRAVRGAIRHPTLRTVDSVAGVAIQAVAVLVAAWLLTTLLTSSGQPNLKAAVEGSRVLAPVRAVGERYLSTVPDRFSALLKSSGLGDVWQPFGGTPIAPVDSPDAALADNAVVAASRPSVVKIIGEASGCQKRLEGSGFVIGNGRVMSNAHVVAGADKVEVEAGGKIYPAQVVSYNPGEDISILDVPNLPAAPLEFDFARAETGTDALVLGYPLGGPFAATPARIRDFIELSGPDIYNKMTVVRTVYTIRGEVQQGNSGGPLIGLDGKVLGVVFGADATNSDTGFALTAAEVREMADNVSTAPVATGSCL